MKEAKQPRMKHYIHCEKGKKGGGEEQRIRQLFPHRRVSLQIKCHFFFY